VRAVTKSTPWIRVLRGSRTFRQVRPLVVEAKMFFEPNTNTRFPPRSTLKSLERFSTRPRTRVNELPPSVERKTPFGPTSSTTCVPIASTACGRVAVPVFKICQDSPELSVRRSVPAASSA
jgi:hypothetical protein